MISVFSGCGGFPARVQAGVPPILKMRYENRITHIKNRGSESAPPI
jgi:hypothetical protein